MIEVHHLNHSRSERLFWILEELNLPYNVHVYLRGDGHGEGPPGAPAELKRTNPLGKSPVIVDAGKVIPESGAIIDYLLHTYAKHPPQWSLADSLGSHFSEGSLMLYMQMTLMISMIKAKDPQEDKIVKSSVGKFSKLVVMTEVQKAVDALEERIAASPTGWFGERDEPSAADYMLAYPLKLNVLAHKRRNLRVGPNLLKWWSRVESRPAYQRGQKRMKEEEAKVKAKL